MLTEEEKIIVDQLKKEGWTTDQIISHIGASRVGATSGIDQARKKDLRKKEEESFLGRAAEGVTGALGLDKAVDVFGSHLARAGIGTDVSTDITQQYVEKPTGKETAGALLQTAAIPAGAVITGGTSLLSQMAAGATVGYLYDIGSDLVNNKSAGEVLTPGWGTATGLALPPVLRGAGAVLNPLVDTVGEGLKGALVGTGEKLGNATSKLAPSGLRQIGSEVAERVPRAINKGIQVVEDARVRGERIRNAPPEVQFAIRSGLDDVLIEGVQQADEATKAGYRQMVDLAEAPKNGLRPNVRPESVAGEAVSQQYQVLNNKRNEIGQQIGAAVDQLSTRGAVDVLPAQRQMRQILYENGIRPDISGQLQFTGKFTPAERSKIQELYNLATEGGEALTPRQIYDMDRMFSKLSRETRFSEVGDIIVDVKLPDGKVGQMSLYRAFRNIYSNQLDTIAPQIAPLNKQYAQLRNLQDDIEDSIVKRGNFESTKDIDPAEFAQTNLRRIFSDAQSAADYRVLADKLDALARSEGYTGANPQDLAGFALKLRDLYPETVPEASFRGGITGGIRDMLGKVLEFGKPDTKEKQDALKLLLGMLDETSFKSGGIRSTIAAGTAAGAAEDQGILDRLREKGYLPDLQKMLGMEIKSKEEVQAEILSKNPNLTDIELNQAVMAYDMKEYGGIRIGDMIVDPNFVGSLARVGGKAAVNVTLKTLDRIMAEIKKPEVSKQTIEQYLARPDITKQEKGIIQKVLDTFETSADNAKIKVEDFVNKVRTNLMPLKVKDAKNYERVKLPDEKRGPIANYGEHVYEAPFPTMGSHHYNDTGYFAHARYEDPGIPNPERFQVVQVEGFGDDVFFEIYGPDGEYVSGPYNIKEVTTGYDETIKNLLKSRPNLYSKISDPTDTRRIIEIQSDLMQEGNFFDKLLSKRDAGYSFIERVTTPDELQTYNDLIERATKVGYQPTKEELRFVDDIRLRARELHSSKAVLPEDLGSITRYNGEDYLIMTRNPPYEAKIEDILADGTVWGIKWEDARQILQERGDTNLIQTDVLADILRTKEVPLVPIKDAKNLEAVSNLWYENYKQVKPYENDWFKRVIREETQLAARDGKKVVQVPVGRTAKLVEGHTVPPTIKNKAGEEVSDVTKLKIGDIITIEDENFSPSKGVFISSSNTNGITRVRYFNYSTGNQVSFHVVGTKESMAKSNPKKKLLEIAPDVWTTEDYARQMFQMGGKPIEPNLLQFVGKPLSEMPTSLELPTELLRYDNLESDAIYNFYEKQVGKYLKSEYGATRVKDAQGMEWWQYNVPEGAGKNPVKAFAGGVLGLEGLKDKVTETETEDATIRSTEPGFFKRMFGAPSVYERFDKEKPQPEQPQEVSTPDKIVKAIAYNETRGENYNYAFRQPSGIPEYGDAIGKYQIIEAELKTWAPRLLGRNVSPDEFQQSPELQEKYIEEKVKFLESEGLNPDEIFAVHRGGMTGWGNPYVLKKKIKQYQEYVNSAAAFMSTLQ